MARALPLGTFSLRCASLASRTAARSFTAFHHRFGRLFRHFRNNINVFIHFSRVFFVVFLLSLSLSLSWKLRPASFHYPPTSDGNGRWLRLLTSNSKWKKQRELEALQSGIQITMEIKKMWMIITALEKARHEMEFSNSPRPMTCSVCRLTEFQIRMWAWFKFNSILIQIQFKLTSS